MDISRVGSRRALAAGPRSAGARRRHAGDGTGRHRSLNYNEGMLALRFAGLLAVAVWFGGLLALGTIAAPSVFDVIDSRQIADGRVLAGDLFGEILRRFHLVGYACGGLILVSLIARAVLGPRPRFFAIRAGLTTVMLASVVYSGTVLTGRIETLRHEIGAAPSSLSEDDPRRQAFRRLHEQSTGLQLVPLIGGLALLIGELLDH